MRSRHPEFFSALPLSAVVVLWLNDTFLKARFHNAVTGKLSDLAGCFVLPLFVAVLLVPLGWSLRVRAGVGALITTAFFAAIKCFDGAARTTASTLEWVTTSLGVDGPHRLLADRTDLVALVMVPLAVCFALAVPSSAEPLS
ncbi:MAG: hypothetical protein GQE15_25930 [Archangiaceae bacterium]|nr:hypothetical protein [Archangiaceae bacterium]